MRHMKKSTAIALLGGTVGKAAAAVNINSQAVSNWPDELTPIIIDRVVAAAVRIGVPLKRIREVLDAEKVQDTAEPQAAA